VWHYHARSRAEPRVPGSAVKVIRRSLPVLVVCSGLVLAGVPAVALAQGTGPSACPAPAPGQGTCVAVAAPGRAAVTEAALKAAGTAPAGYSPANLQDAYSLSSASATGGVGQTVAVVTAYGDSTADSSAQTDVGTYRSEFGLPACTTASGCFTTVDADGGTNYPASGPAGWTLTDAEELDAVSAVCPNCHLLLVEADQPQIPTTTTGGTTETGIGQAVNEAVALGAKFVVTTLAEPEVSGETSWDTAYFDHPGVVIAAPDGYGTGYGTSYPAASPDVVAVGGTTLTQDTSTARGWTESAWSDTGSGCSAYEPKPSWQTDTGCASRMLNDVSAVASPNTPVAVYDTSSGGWVADASTGTAAAIVAAAYALGGTPAASTSGASYLYAHPSLFNDITSGSDGTCSITYFCTAGPGYDGPTGLGTPAEASGFEVAYQASTTDLDFYDAGALDITTSGMAAGTSPAITALPAGGWVAAFQANTTDLTIDTSAGGLETTTLEMAPGTSPAIAVLPDGGWVVAFQANTTDLYTYTSAGAATNTTLGMLKGTSPSIAATPSGGWVIAYQANTTDLFTYTSGGALTNTTLGMLQGTSPAVAVLPDGRWVIAFQANTTDLFTYTPGVALTNTTLGMLKGTSPAVAVTPSGGWVVAFQANTTDLYTYTSTRAWTNTTLGMLPGTNPSIAATPSGGWVIAYQANTTDLFTYTSAGALTNTTLGMLQGTSPAIAALVLGAWG
jgi:hypothetical protein